MSMMPSRSQSPRMAGSPMSTARAAGSNYSGRTTSARGGKSTLGTKAGPAYRKIVRKPKGAVRTGY
jgi:hypothetical protein